MKPQRLRHLLDGWFDGTLDREQRHELDESARSDGEVARALARQERLVRALSRLDDPRLHPFDVERFVAAVAARVDGRPATRARPKAVLLALVAAAGVAALVGLWVVLRQDAAAPGAAPRAPLASTDGVPRSTDAPAPAELVAAAAATDPGWIGPVFEVAAVAPVFDPQRLADATRATADVLRGMELPRWEAPEVARAWRDDVRRAIELAVGRSWTVNTLAERCVAEARSVDELALVAAFLLVGDESAGRRRVSRVLEEDAAAAVGEAGGLAPSSVRAAWRRAVLAVGSGDLVAELVAAGAFDVSDAPQVVERFLADASLAPRLLRRALGGVDADLLAALVGADGSLVEPLVESALAGRGSDRVVVALRDVPAARAAVAERLAVARSNGERRRVLRLVGAVGALEALADVRSACLDGEIEAFDTLRLLPGPEALEVWIELAPQLAPARRTVAWYAFVERRSHELVAFVAGADAGDERLLGLADALVATGSQQAAEVLLELAARQELHVLERAACVDDALALGAGRVLEGDVVVAALTRVADGAPDDVRVQEACLVLVRSAAGHERAADWCLRRFGDDGPSDLLGEDFDAGAPRATAVRARLRLLLERLLTNRSGA